MPKIYFSSLVRELNTDPGAFVLAAERQFDSELDCLADAVAADRSLRVVLLSGPSGSGKTTTANILRDKLTARGRTAAVVSLDDFFLEKNNYPVNDAGEPDFESVYALDVPLVKRCIAEIAAEGQTTMPRFDFKTQSRFAAPRRVCVGGEGVVIIEGIHALNPIISEGLGSVLKVFVSVSTGIKNDADEEIVSGIDIRMLRRLIRDRLYRGFGAENTLSIWKSVLRGEREYLYPFKELADFKINTFHSYETFVYAGYIAENMAEETARLCENEFYPVLQRLSTFPPLSADFVPDSSIIREFIPGGMYEHIYLGNEEQPS